MDTATSTDPVLYKEHSTQNGKIIAQATLNAPKSLNALNLDMIHSLRSKLSEWNSRSNIAAIWLEGSGDKAFCAGGDVIKLYESMKMGDFEFPDSFFEHEYSLDLSLHQLKKPLLVWGDGVVMGGGMGLMQGARFRLVTERTMMAMPEITIGLYPDVGASHFLHRCPNSLGLFEALTGARLNATDALKLNFADHFVSSSCKEELLTALLSTSFKSNDDQNIMLITKVLMDLSERCSDLAPASQLEAHESWISETFAHHKLSHIDQAIREHHTDDKWLSRALDSYKNGSPRSAMLIFEQFQRSGDWSIEDAFSYELRMSAHCARSGEFQEGVRALLIDKDGRPKWKASSIAEISINDVKTYFEPIPGKTLELKYMI